MDPAIGVSSSCNELNRGETLVIVGASARAAAMSARRGGLRPWAADLFGDLDLRACCPVGRIDAYPDGLEQAIAAAPIGPWMYTGALENHPALVDRMAAMRPLYGVSGESLRAVRDPLRLAMELRAAGFAVPLCSRSPDGVPTDASWLAKPLASAGGHQIATWRGEPKDARMGSGRYFQQRIDGLPASAVYLGLGDEAIWLGATRQLIGLPWCGVGAKSTNRFCYCGSIGPMEASPELAERFQKLGDAVAESFGLIGLFGVDVMLASGEIWPIEVNPRYTASIEVLERTCGFSAVRLHVETCRQAVGQRRGAEKGDIQLFPFGRMAGPDIQGKSRMAPFSCRDGRSAGGKAVVYCAANSVVRGEFVDWAERRNQGREWPAVADVPAAGTAIRKGHPIVTVLAEENDEISVLSRLQALAAEVYQKLAVSPANANNCGGQVSH